MDVKNFEITSWESYDKIIEILQNDFENNIMALGFIRTANSVRDKVEPNEEFLLLTPGGEVDEYATFIVLEKMGGITVFFYSCNSDEDRMMNLLKNCKYIDWQENILFGPVPEKFLNGFSKLAEEMELKVTSSPLAYLYWIEPEAGKKLTYACPPEVYMDAIREEHAELINSVWPHRSENSVNWVKRVIALQGGLGIFTKDGGELVSWALNSLLGGPGLLQTVESHKRKGYGNIVAKAVTKNFSNKNEHAVLYIMSNNIPSQELFKKLGYIKGCNAQFCSTKPQ